MKVAWLSSCGLTVRKGVAFVLSSANLIRWRAVKGATFLYLKAALSSLITLCEKLFWLCHLLRYAFFSTHETDVSILATDFILESRKILMLFRQPCWEVVSRISPYLELARHPRPRRLMPPARRRPPPRGIPPVYPQPPQPHALGAPFIDPSDLDSYLAPGQPPPKPSPSPAPKFARLKALFEELGSRDGCESLLAEAGLSGGAVVGFEKKRPSLSREATGGGNWDRLVPTDRRGV